MTPDPWDAVLDELAACRERVTETDMREAAHFGELRSQLAQLTTMVATVRRALAEDTAALARLDALDRQVAELATRSTGRAERDDAAYQPSPAPAWWKLTAAERKAPVVWRRSPCPRRAVFATLTMSAGVDSADSRDAGRWATSPWP